jgi:hypothetical protein
MEPMGDSSGVSRENIPLEIYNTDVLSLLPFAAPISNSLQEKKYASGQQSGIRSVCA